jgi:hypothetical protein
VPSHQFTVPSHKGLGADEETSPPSSRQEPAQPRRDRAVRWPQRGPSDLAAQDCDLMAEHDHLDGQFFFPAP